MKKEKLFSLTAKDFKVEFMTAHVKAGGGGKDTSNTACRITHIESGAVGQSKDERSQLQNKKIAFQRLCASEKFKKWMKLKTAFAMRGIMDMEKELNRQVDDALQQKNLKIESYDPEEGQ